MDRGCSTGVLVMWWQVLAVAAHLCRLALGGAASRHMTQLLPDPDEAPDESLVSRHYYK